MIAGVLFFWASLGYAGKGDGAVTWLVGKEALLDTEVLIYGGAAPLCLTLGLHFT